MSRTPGGIRTADLRSRLAEEARDAPDWRPLLRLLERAIAEVDAPAWRGVEVALPDPPAPSAAPRLAGATVHLPARHARRLLRALLRESAGTPRLERAAALGREDALEVIEASLNQDADRVATVAARIGADAPALTTVSQLALLPILHACSRYLDGAGDATPSSRERTHTVAGSPGALTSAPWREGYCPLCGAWPVLAELRGIERARHLRCGRCSGDWELPLLLCPFCGENDHRQLASLLPEGEENRRRVDCCRSCNGYIKTITTVRAVERGAVLLEDLRTVDLDLVARDRAFDRPLGPGLRLEVRAEANDRGLGRFLRSRMGGDA